VNNPDFEEMMRAMRLNMAKIMSENDFFAGGKFRKAEKGHFYDVPLKKPENWPKVPNRPKANSPYEQEHEVTRCCGKCGGPEPTPDRIHFCGPWKEKLVG
jgi:hypothetical protein